MTAPELETYLHEHIPLSAAMQLSVVALSERGVTLSAPLAPNVNHRNSVFGGSLASLATLAGWSLVHAGLLEIGLPSRVVVMSSQIEYLAPAVGRFEATCRRPEPRAWERFQESVRRRGKGRIALAVEVHSESVLAATLAGSFVAVAPPKIP